MKQDKTIISNGESHEIEFKLTFQKEVIESVVAFANATGGIIYIGVVYFLNKSLMAE